MSIKERIRSYLGVSPRSGTGFTTLDRTLSAETRKLNAELKNLEKQQAIAEIRNQIARVKDEMRPNEEEEESTELPLAEKLAEKILMKMLEPKPQDNTTVDKRISMTDNDLNSILANIPKKYIKQLKNMDNDAMFKLIQAQLPNINDETTERAILLVKAI